MIVGAFSKIEGPGPQFWKTDWQRTMIMVQGATLRALVKLHFSKIEGPGPQFWKTTTFLKNGQLRGQKHLENAHKKILQLANIYKIYILQKNWSKSTNPALSSGPNISLPLIWGCHHQLDDQHKEPMVNTKIIYLGN